MNKEELMDLLEEFDEDLPVCLVKRNRWGEREVLEVGRVDISIEDGDECLLLQEDED
jgi:hypothetical protein